MHGIVPLLRVLRLQREHARGELVVPIVEAGGQAADARRRAGGVGVGIGDNGRDGLPRVVRGRGRVGDGGDEEEDAGAGDEGEDVEGDARRGYDEHVAADGAASSLCSSERVVQDTDGADGRHDISVQWLAGLACSFSAEESSVGGDLPRRHQGNMQPVNKPPQGLAAPDRRRSTATSPHNDG